MATNKYGNVLTILLVIIIIIIIAAVGFIVYKIVNDNKGEDGSQQAIAAFNKDVFGQGGSALGDGDGQGGTGTIDDPTNPSGGGSGSGGSGNLPKKQYYEGYVMIGHIEIPKTGIKYPILERGTDKALEVSVAVMYPDDAINKLNQPGNVCIMGHNYRNGKFFSDNKKLSTGDKIKITSYSGTLTYTIYEIFETTPGDTRYISRDTKGGTEITLSTCSDDGAKRLIIQAKAD